MSRHLHLLLVTLLVALGAVLLVEGTTSNKIAFADGGGCVDADIGSISPAGGGSSATYTAASGQIITAVCIKTGEASIGHTGQIEQNGTYQGCYSISGLGTNSVSVTRLGSGPECQELSHIDVYLGGTTPTNTPVASVTSSPTQSVTHTPTPTDTPNTGVSEETPTSTSTPDAERETPSPTSTSVDDETPTPSPTNTPDSEVGSVNPSPTNTPLAEVGGVRATPMPTNTRVSEVGGVQAPSAGSGGLLDQDSSAEEFWLGIAAVATGLMLSFIALIRGLELGQRKGRTK